MSIIFKSNTGEQIFSLTNFTNKGDGLPTIGYEFCFISNGFEVKVALEAERFDLEHLLKGLTYINANLNGGCYFEPMISGRIRIKIEMTGQGQINIDGVVNDPSYNTQLSFKFLSDQTFLPDLIAQCTTTIKSLN